MKKGLGLLCSLFLLVLLTACDNLPFLSSDGQEEERTITHLRGISYVTLQKGNYCLKPRPPENGEMPCLQKGEEVEIGSWFWNEEGRSPYPPLHNSNEAHQCFFRERFLVIRPFVNQNNTALSTTINLRVVKTAQEIYSNVSNKEVKIAVYQVFREDSLTPTHWMWEETSPPCNWSGSFDRPDVDPNPERGLVFRAVNTGIMTLEVPTEGTTILRAMTPEPMTAFVLQF